MSSENGATQEGTRAPLHVTEEARELVERLTDRLGLWETSTDAALFLASLALAHGHDPVSADELGETVVLEAPAEPTDTGADHLVLLGVLRDRELAGVLEEEFAGLVEAGSRLLEPRLAKQSPARTTQAVAQLLAEIE